MALSISRGSAEYLRTGNKFRLGCLMTEKSHPITRHLSEVPIAEGLRLLNKVDYQIPPVFNRLASENKLDLPIDAVVNAIHRGNKIFVTGCGATGRLSIQMDAMWRRFWKGTEYADRIFSIMAGGDYALIKSVEGFEDKTDFGRRQICEMGLSAGDIVFAVTEGGETSHVIGTAWEGVRSGADVFFIYNNPDAILIDNVERSREIIWGIRVTKINMTTGPQSITGSTRMQAASIETLILASMLETASLRLSGKSSKDIRDLAEASYDIPAFVERAIPDLAKLVELESQTYLNGCNFNHFGDPYPDRGYANYIAGADSSLIVLTDTTERAPTFNTSPFRTREELERGAKISPVYMTLDAVNNESAWTSMLQRPIRGLDWGYGIANDDILKFVISGADVLKFRPIGAGNLTVGICLGDEVDLLRDKNSFLYQTLIKAKRQGGRTALIAVTDKEIDFDNLPPLDVKVLLTDVPSSPFKVAQSLVLKMLLNTLSTEVMVKMGRVKGNYMTYVTPTNMKLIDRATRYVSALSGVSYDVANDYIFSVMEDTEEDRKAGKGLPPTVLIALKRIEAGVNTDEAIRLLIR